MNALYDSVSNVVHNTSTQQQVVHDCPHCVKYLYCSRLLTTSAATYLSEMHDWLNHA